MDAYTESEISSLSLEWEDDDDMMNDYFIPSPPEMCVQCRVRNRTAFYFCTANKMITN